jgi:WD40 repeat protein
MLLGVPQTLVLGLAFTPDGSTVIAATVAGTVRFYATGRGRSTGTLPNGNGDTAGLLAISPDGRTLAVAAGARMSRSSATSGPATSASSWE